jgi:hypothetical protein
MFGKDKRVEWLRQELDQLRAAHIELRDYCVKLTDDVNKWAQGMEAQLEKLNEEATK